ncbi:hypothetical protein ACELLULO517_26685 [Acidisoma cellulosilytica]|uniref:Tetratricopeptide repeat protein n=1 Tax=Acidisoma cellulosilyticum TaxID=2802395 RepID=A0A964E6V7_9PROT|nr:hypothetical protein [Acidisoma cellulosilyticum]
MAFQLRMHGSENIAHFFDWLATPIDGLIRIIERNFDVFHPEHLTLRLDHTPHCVQDVVTGVTFHHQFPLYAHHVQPDFLLHYPAFIKKFQYLADRFRTYMATRPVTLVRRVIDYDKALRLERAVKTTFPDADVRFLYLLNQGVGFTTPLGQAHVIGTDDSSFGDPLLWVPILSDAGLIDRPYRRATIEVLGVAHDDYNLGIERRFTVAQLTAAIAANPENAAFLVELAQWYALQGQWQDMLVAAERAIACNPSVWGAAFYAGWAAWSLGRLTPHEAADRLQRQAHLPDARPSWALIAAEALRLAGRVPEALICLDQAMKADPLDYRLYFEKANCLRDPKDAREMVLVVQAARRLAGDRPSYLHEHYLANALEALGDLEGALQAAERTVSGPPIFSFLWTYAGLLHKLGRNQAALEALERARAVANPEQLDHLDVVVERIKKRIAVAIMGL